MNEHGVSHLKKQHEHQLWLHESKMSGYLLNVLQRNHTPLDMVYSTLLRMAPNLSQHEYVHHLDRSELFDQVYAEYQKYCTHDRQQDSVQSFFSNVQHAQQQRLLSERATLCSQVSMTEFETSAFVAQEFVKEVKNQKWIHLFQKVNQEAPQCTYAIARDESLREEKLFVDVDLATIVGEVATVHKRIEDDRLLNEEKSLREELASSANDKQLSSNGEQSNGTQPTQKIRRISRKARQTNTEHKAPPKSPSKSPRRSPKRSSKRAKRSAPTQLAPSESKRSKHTTSEQTLEPLAVVEESPSHPAVQKPEKFENSLAVLRNERGDLCITRWVSVLGRSSRSCHVDHDLTQYDTGEEAKSRAKLSRRQAVLRATIEDGKMVFRLQNVGKLTLFKVHAPRKDQEKVDFTRIQCNEFSVLNDQDKVVFPLKRTFRFVINQDKVKEYEMKHAGR
uniref:Uncharacterized protein n=1 Tax=Percolomonas cosmopolitus TaxID=63605 RepID=A0A7S1KLT5_9EUKA|mmetsp:Transcript_11314/g.42412  ORF Transcript_11314/g.42412 Transcript_11314/m.42412 type:complete len:449 (+) Transcript_11314:104-1450(+)